MLFSLHPDRRLHRSPAAELPWRTPSSFLDVRPEPAHAWQHPQVMGQGQGPLEAVRQLESRHSRHIRCTHGVSTGGVVLPILLPCIAVLLLLLLAVVFFRWLHRRKLRKSSSYSAKGIKLGQHRSWPSMRSDEEHQEEEDISIPSLSTRFSYEELVAATEGFRTRIGSGGFGEVYKGMLPDKTTVAVKRISNIGVQVKREFCTEMAVIGNIQHSLTSPRLIPSTTSSTNVGIAAAQPAR